jgi:hypothetical protein
MLFRRMMSLFLPVLVLSIGFMPGMAKACQPTCDECCCSLITVNIDIQPTIVLINNEPILSYNTVNVASWWNYVDILNFTNFLNGNQIANNNETELNFLFKEFNVLSENQIVVGVIYGTVYYLDKN